MQDEKSITVNWAENVEIEFLQCLQYGDYVAASECIAEMKSVYPMWAKEMQKKFGETELSNFTHKSAIQRHDL